MHPAPACISSVGRWRRRGAAVDGHVGRMGGPPLSALPVQAARAGGLRLGSMMKKRAQAACA